MRAVKRTCFEFLVLGAIGLALGFGANAVRARGSIKPTKNYFDMSVPTAKSAPVKSPDKTLPPGARTGERDSTVSVVESRPVAPAAGTDGHDPNARQEETASRTRAQEPADHPKHDFQTISFEEVVAVFNDPNTRGGLNVFVDARNDDLFAEGRIPGAVQCDPYEQERYLPDVLDRTSGAEKVIVYCGGGDCQDSVFMCRDLIMQGVSFDSVYLFEGGWKEWEANDMPIEKNE